MSLLGTLGKLALGLVPGGGTAATVANLVGAGLDAAGNIEKGREAGRASDNANTMNQDVLRQRAAQDFEGNVENRAGIDLQQRKFAQDSQSDAFKKAILSSVMQNLKDVKLNMPKNIPVFDFGNGLRPSALGSQGLDAAKVMQQLAMEKLMNGEKFDAMPALQQFQPSALKSGGKLDTILGIAGATGNVLDQLGAASKGNEQDTLIKRLLAAQKQQQPAGDVPTTLTNPSGMFGGAGVPLASDQYLFH